MQRLLILGAGTAGVMLANKLAGRLDAKHSEIMVVGPSTVHVLGTLSVRPNLILSTPAELRLVLRWMAILRGRVRASLAATTGVHGPSEAIKLILAGADVTMMASALLPHGAERLTETVDGLRNWLEERGYASLEEAKGSLSQQAVADPALFERANYMKTLVTYSPPW